MDEFAPEISDLIVDCDPRTLERRDVRKQDVLDRLRTAGAPPRALRVVRRLPERGGVLDREAVDALLLRAHLELQRLHEEFQVAATLRSMLLPMIGLVASRGPCRPLRIVDLGCGLGHVVRWLAARGGLGDGVELVGADTNQALVVAAQRLADDEALDCRFVVGNAFALQQPAHIVISTGVLHHFRGGELDALFADHERAGILGFLHADIRPGALASFGAWMFHQARMREPLARYDGVQSALRAHDPGALRSAMKRAVPGFSTAMIDARPGVLALARIFVMAVGFRGARADVLAAYSALGARLETV